MLSEIFVTSSFDQLKDLFFHQLTILNIASAYILMYVIYKAFGRYVYFKPQEHASKINRTFLTLSIIIVSINVIWGISNYLPVLSEYRGFYMLCGLVILMAPLSIIMDRMIWKYDSNGRKERRDWHYYYLQISRDYYKTNITKSERHDNYSETWEEEAVESTEKNIHSDALLNILALAFFIGVSGKWAYESAKNYGYLSYIFSIIICLTISSIFLDHTVFSWISYIEKEGRKLFRK